MQKDKALEILGFSADDDPDDKEINKAFKKKAVKLHPDVNKAENAEEQFKEVNAAKESLLNPQPEFQDFAGRRYQSNSDPFADFFRNGPRVRFSVPPIEKHLRISFRDSVLGSRQTIKVDKKSRCEDCACPECNGVGAVERTVVRGNMMFSTTTSCQKCKGEGRDSDNCKACSGKGVVQKTHEFSINLQGGVMNGSFMRLRGFGNIENHMGRLYPGDIILKVTVEHDKDMRIQGMNVISSIDVPLLEALKGTTRKVRTVLGETTITIKKNTKHKDMIALSKYGVAKHGDHLFFINVRYPKDTSKLIEALEDK